MVSLLISMTLPTMLSVMQSSTTDMAAKEARRLAREIVELAEEVGAGGPGNVRTFALPQDAPSGIVMRVGGEEGTADCRKVEWKVGERIGAVYLEATVLLTCDGMPLELGAGDKVRLECPPQGWGMVMVRRA